MVWAHQHVQLGQTKYMVRNPLPRTTCTTELDPSHERMCVHTVFSCICREQRFILGLRLGFPPHEGDALAHQNGMSPSCLQACKLKR